jgi:hypothetical protein
MKKRNAVIVAIAVMVALIIIAGICISGYEQGQSTTHTMLAPLENQLSPIEQQQEKSLPDRLLEQLNSVLSGLPHI